MNPEAIRISKDLIALMEENDRKDAEEKAQKAEQVLSDFLADLAPDQLLVLQRFAALNADVKQAAIDLALSAESEKNAAEYRQRGILSEPIPLTPCD